MLGAVIQFRVLPTVESLSRSSECVLAGRPRARINFKRNGGVEEEAEFEY